MVGPGVAPNAVVGAQGTCSESAPLSGPVPGSPAELTMPAALLSTGLWAPSSPQRLGSIQRPAPAAPWELAMPTPGCSPPWLCQPTLPAPGIPPRAALLCAWRPPCSPPLQRAWGGIFEAQRGSQCAAAACSGAPRAGIGLTPFPGCPGVLARAAFLWERPLARRSTELLVVFVPSRGSSSWGLGGNAAWGLVFQPLPPAPHGPVSSSLCRPLWTRGSPRRSELEAPQRSGSVLPAAGPWATPNPRRGAAAPEEEVALGPALGP